MLQRSSLRAQVEQHDGNRAAEYSRGRDDLTWAALGDQGRGGGEGPSPAPHQTGPSEILRTWDGGMEDGEACCREQGDEQTHL